MSHSNGSLTCSTGSSSLGEPVANSIFLEMALEHCQQEGAPESWSDGCTEAGHPELAVQVTVSPK